MAGHVASGSSLPVFTTAEVVLGECAAAEFYREHDGDTGYAELVVRERREEEEEEK